MKTVINPSSLPNKLGEWNYKERTLWFLGNQSLIKLRCVSVIGTRNPSQLGIERARKITKILVENGFCVVSGMALGIDAIAHQTALQLRGKTIAVMGTPIDKCYPAEHKALKNRIAKTGLVISQFAPGTPVRPQNFPIRNQLMAALADMTIVIEAGEKSGVRYQVEAAIAYHRYVGFLPNVAEMDYPWVKEALKSGYGMPLINGRGLLNAMSGNKNEMIAPLKRFENSPVQMDFLTNTPVIDVRAPASTVGKTKASSKGWIGKLLHQIRRMVHS